MYFFCSYLINMHNNYDLLLLNNLMAKGQVRKNKRG